jgi:protein subunit release factor A
VALEEKRAGDRHRKARWRQAISERNVVRTYNFKRNEVKDHRTGETANLQAVLEGGDIDLLKTLVYFEGLRRAEMERKSKEQIADELEGVLPQ